MGDARPPALTYRGRARQEHGAARSCTDQDHRPPAGQGENIPRGPGTPASELAPAQPPGCTGDTALVTSAARASPQVWGRGFQDSGLSGAPGAAQPRWTRKSCGRGRGCGTGPCEDSHNGRDPVTWGWRRYFRLKVQKTEAMTMTLTT